MKIFSLGFILAFVISSLVQPVNLTTIKEFFESMIVILPSILLLNFIFWQVVNAINKRFRYKKQFCLLNNDWQCLLIDGAWGSGKTTHYEKHYQYIDDKPNIYISCFSASRGELIAQIIQQQFWCKLLTLNGLLAKFMENNWQIFMPKNRVVVFDDLERLHANQDNYLDLIGIIDYLKDKMKCQIILICNISELKEPIFNTYMERIVDETEFPILMSKEEFKNSLIENPNDLIKELLVRLYSDYVSWEINNLRIIKNIMPKIAKKLESNYLEFDEVRQVLNGSQHEINALISKHYLFYNDNAFFKECAEFYNNKKVYTTSDNEEKIGLRLLSRLNKYKISYDQQAQTFFKCQDYKTWRDIGEILQPNFNDFLRLDIEANLKLDDNVIHDDGIRIQNLIIQYLEKYINKNTRNNFESGDYALWLLYVLYHAKYEGYDELFECVLTSEFMVYDDRFTPLKSDTFSLLSVFRPSNKALFMKLFEIKELNENGFLTKYFDFYRKKTIDKFISSLEIADYTTLQNLGEPWFKDNYSSVDYDFIEEKTGSSVLDLLYYLTNKCVNLKVIADWTDRGVLIPILTEYYISVIDAFKNMLNDPQKTYINLKIDELINFKPCDIPNHTGANLYPLMELCSEKYSSFAKMRDKLFKFRNIVEAYIKSNELELQKFTKYNNDNLEIIEKLFVEKTTEDNSNNIDKENNESAT